jgi:CheY-like chemotaxis protein
MAGGVLKVVKADPDLRRLPVIVLKGSVSDDDVLRSYDLHANAYIRKAAKRSDLMDIADSIRSFWFSVVELPPG